MFKWFKNKKTRTYTDTQKIQTDFGSMYIHIHYDQGRPCGAWISNPGKEPNSQIHKLILDISTGLNEVLKQ